MHFQFLIEDLSGQALIDAVMLKIKKQNDSVSYDCKAFHGIGGYGGNAKKKTAKETKTGKLLNDLAIYLRGFNKSLQHFAATVVVVLDNDDRDTASFQTELENIARANKITIDHVFCIAVEEVEAWLLGDTAALLAAYPNAKQAILHAYCQDSLCGTWELLANVLYPGGYAKMQKDCPSYMEIGKKKSEWARAIGMHMDLSANRSPSFNLFLNEINRRIATVTC